MNATQYQTTSRSTRSVFAVIAVATVVGLFDFVAGLGGTSAGAMAQLHAAPVANVASAAAHNVPVSFMQ